MREISRKYREIGKKLIASMEELSDVRDFEVRVAFLSSDQEKKKNHKIVFADCTKVSEQYEWCCKYDFFITIYEPNVQQFNFSSNQMRILLLHELMHCGVDCSGDEPKYYVKPHDVEEFDAIIEKFGVHWEVGDE